MNHNDLSNQYPFRDSELRQAAGLVRQAMLASLSDAPADYVPSPGFRRRMGPLFARARRMEVARRGARRGVAAALGPEELVCDDLEGLGKGGSGLIGEPHNLRGAPGQVETALGRGDASGVTLEERRAELALECGDLARKRRLGYVQHVGSARHGSLLAHGEKVAQRTEFHVASPITTTHNGL